MKVFIFKYSCVRNQFKVNSFFFFFLSIKPLAFFFYKVDRKTFFATIMTTIIVLNYLCLTLIGIMFGNNEAVKYFTSLFSSILNQLTYLIQNNKGFGLFENIYLLQSVILCFIQFLFNDIYWFPSFYSLGSNFYKLSKIYWTWTIFIQLNFFYSI